MYTIVWYEYTGKCCVVCDGQSMSIMVNLLELNKKEFRVYTEGCQLTPSQCGMGGFSYWLTPTTKPHING